MDEQNGTPADEFTLARRGNIDAILAPGGARRQSLRGFDPEYTDIVDYIIRCTHRIWEEKGVGLIYTHYSHNAVVHAGNRTIYGREDMITGTLQMLAAFPERRIYADDVIWAGDDEVGFHTSHHSTSIGHHTGPGPFGPATGRRVMIRAIANCFVRENLITEEWLLRDDLALIRQIGLDERAIVERQVAAALAAPAPSPASHGDLGRTVGQLMPPVLPPSARAGFDVEDFVRRTYHELWNWRLLNVIRERYAEDYRCHTASDRRLYGHGDLEAFVLSILAAIPDLKVTVEHVYWNGDDRAGHRVAVRWTLTGTHDGHGIFGEPSGARVEVMGLSQHHINGGKFASESTIFDEFDLLKQIHAARLTGAAGMG